MGTTHRITIVLSALLLTLTACKDGPSQPDATTDTSDTTADAVEDTGGDGGDTPDATEVPGIGHQPCAPTLTPPRNALLEFHAREYEYDLPTDVTASGQTVVAAIRDELITFREGDDGQLVEVARIQPIRNAQPVELGRLDATDSLVAGIDRASGDVALIEVLPDGTFGELEWMATAARRLAVDGEHVVLLEVSSRGEVFDVSSYDIANPSSPVREWTVGADRYTQLTAANGYAYYSRTTRTFWQLRSIDLDGATGQPDDTLEAEELPLRMHAGAGRLLVTFRQQTGNGFGVTREFQLESGQFGDDLVVEPRDHAAFAVLPDYNVLEDPRGSLTFRRPGGSEFVFAYGEVREPSSLAMTQDHLVFADQASGVTGFDISQSTDMRLESSAIVDIDSNEVHVRFPYVFYLTRNTLVAADVSDAGWSVVDRLEFDDEVDFVGASTDELILSKIYAEEGSEGFVVTFDGDVLEQSRDFTAPDDLEDVQRAPTGWWARTRDYRSQLLYLADDSSQFELRRESLTGIQHFDIVGPFAVLVFSNAVRAYPVESGNISDPTWYSVREDRSVSSVETIHLPDAVVYSASEELFHVDLSTASIYETQMTYSRTSDGRRMSGLSVGNVLFASGRSRAGSSSEVTMLDPDGSANGFFSFTPPDQQFEARAERDGLLITTEPVGTQGRTRIGYIDLCAAHAP